VYLKQLGYAIFALLAAASVAASSASCSKGMPQSGVVASHDGGESPDSEARPAPQPDTLALVEGLMLFENGEYDLAREQLLVSARSDGTYFRAESYLYLNALEMELGNYTEARAWLEKYHAETVRLLREAADTSRNMARQAALLRTRQNILIAGVTALAAVVAGALALRARRRGGAIPKRTGAGGDDGTGGGTMIEPLSEWRRYLADAETFKRTEIWSEVVALAAQTPGRAARVLTSARQEVLDEALTATFSDFAAALRKNYPTLTAGDVKLCCLSLLPLSVFGRALCYGSTETNIIKQRKHTIKRKLTTDPHGNRIFDFIFEKRD
jgi:hypothetical protein